MMVSPFQTIQQVPALGYISFCMIDDRFKIIYNHLKNENVPLALHFVKETVNQIRKASLSDCDASFVNYVLGVLMLIQVDLVFHRITEAHNKIRNVHYAITNQFLI